VDGLLFEQKRPYVMLVNEELLRARIWMRLPVTLGLCILGALFIFLDKPEDIAVIEED
jgi:hypothetical protein